MKPSGIELGQRFGRLEAIEINVKWKSDNLTICRCDCGTTKRIYSYSLLKGRSKSCGCWNRELIIERSRKHKTK